jgi:predicted restriction endonuclease
METFEQTMKRLKKQKETTSQYETSKQIVLDEFMRLQMMNSLTYKEQLEMEFLESVLNAPFADDIIRVANKIKG